MSHEETGRQHRCPMCWWDPADTRGPDELLEHLGAGLEDLTVQTTLLAERLKRLQRDAKQLYGVARRLAILTGGKERDGAEETV